MENKSPSVCFDSCRKKTLLTTLPAHWWGKAWGKVNYFFAPCTSNHLHIVWQKQNELRRACAYDSPRGRNLQELKDRAYDLTCLLQLLCWQDSPTPPTVFIEKATRYQVNFSWRNGDITEWYMCRDLIDLLNVRYHHGRPIKPDLLNSAIKQYQELLKIAPVVTWQDIDRMVSEKKAEAKAFEQRWTDSYQELEKIDQLYIAV